jgi:hypothetical protein
LRAELVEARHVPFDKLIAQHYDGWPASPTAGARGWSARKVTLTFASDEGGESGGLPVRVQLTQDPERLGMTYTAAHLAPSPIRSQQ